MDTIQQLQIGITIAFQQLGGLTGLMKAFSFLGQEEFFLFALPVVYWCVDASTGGRLAVLLVLSNSVNVLLKLAFHLPRPYWVDSRVQALATETSYGLPSGHAQNAVSIWFFFAGAFQKHPEQRDSRMAKGAWLAAAAVVLMISLSRIYLGVHFVTDVIGGWIVGAILLAAFLKFESKAKEWLKTLGTWGQVGAAFGAALVVALLGVGVRATLAGSPDPSAWAGFAAEARNLEAVFSSAGTVFGVGAGLALASRWARFDAGGQPAKRAARFVIGLIGAMIFYLGLRFVFPREPEAVGMFFRFVRYALTTWWVIFLAPWVFLKINLADSVNRFA